MHRRSGLMTLSLVLFALCLLVAEPSRAQQRPATGDLNEATRLNEQVIRLYVEGRYDEAIPLAVRALAIREKSLGADHPSTATSLSNLALLYEAKGDYARAEPLYRRALAITEKVLGADHPDTSASLNNLAELYQAKGDYAQAVQMIAHAAEGQERHLVRI